MIAPASSAGPRPFFPFSAIIGQERMKLALLLVAIDPGIGGALIRGEKGTAKSTAARALAGLLAAVDAEARLVTLPLNATEEMVAGGLDFSATLRTGERAFQPGVLARAHGGVLYIDEVNLLDDHLVDLILDAAEFGVNIVEREGLSVQHDCRFALIGTMNPEEGALRPQLLDRFGLCVEVASERDPEVRVTLIERREAYERDPGAFARACAEEDAAVAARIARARAACRGLRLSTTLRGYIGELTMSRHVAGHRADLVIARAAIAHAAWQGRAAATVDDVLAVAEMALLHRQREALPPPPPPPR
ncbi:MAG TPA: ATP-binding protein, partial [Armatimonadota bacterium]|nr:ATP-binding protein [Armatimonadota bacterium]